MSTTVEILTDVVRTLIAAEEAAFALKIHL
jgi:hypothetical protein